MSQPERDRQPPGWAIAYEYTNADVARQVYEAVRDAILVDEASDASVFRFTVGERSYVAIATEAPLPEGEQRRAASLLASQGMLADLPGEVFGHLHERRRGFKSTGLSYFERRS